MVNDAGEGIVYAKLLNQLSAVVPVGMLLLWATFLDTGPLPSEVQKAREGFIVHFDHDGQQHQGNLKKGCK